MPVYRRVGTCAHAVIRGGEIIEHDIGAGTYHRVEYFRPGG